MAGHPARPDRALTAVGEDFLRDADDITALMGDGAHLVGHSYGGLGAMFAAARRPEASRSLTLLEPAALTLGQDHAGRTGARARGSQWLGRRCPGRGVGRHLPEGGGERPGRVPARVPRCGGAARSGVPPRSTGLGLGAAAGRARLGPVPQARRLRRPPRRVRGRSATIWRIGSARLGRWSRVPDTRSSSPDRPSTRSCSRSGGAEARSARGVMTVGAAAGRRGTRGAAVPRPPLVTCRTEVSRCP